ncbi:Copper radical oxidase [Mycena venus]|uniref:Copper radical oxidase n=1 Tax=Mycena venus TaxID=2733690 RepID=A0A8H6X594_9AGAR|nr:Copper radical oxidase [Mycena venus]
MFHCRLLPLALVFHSALAAHFHKRALGATAPAGWNDQGCYTDDVRNRILSDASYSDDAKMTIEACTSYCDGKGFKYSGLEYGKECYCGANAPSGGPGNAADCNMPCSGNTEESCGAGCRKRVYSKEPESQPASALCTAAPAPWDYQGCYPDKRTDRILSDATYTDGQNMSIEACTSYCCTGGYSYAGMEYGKECYCGNYLRAQDVAANPADCNMQCTGNATESCGAGNRIQVYYNAPPPASTPGSVGENGQWKHIGCYMDDTKNRTLPRNTNIAGDMTAEKCTSTCQANNFTVAGLEYSTECWCGNSLGGASSTDDADCNMVCTGDDSQICGGPSRLTVFQDRPPSADSGNHTSNNTEAATTCVQTSTDYDFTLKAVYKADDSETLLSVVNIDQNVSILTDCSTCKTPFVSQKLVHGQLQALHAEHSSGAAVSTPVEKGETVVFKHAEQKTYTEYCTVHGPEDPDSEEATLLAVNGAVGQWHLCPNSKVDGRQVVVWDPIQGHKDYEYTECKGVILVMEYCEDRRRVGSCLQ